MGSENKTYKDIQEFNKQVKETFPIRDNYYVYRFLGHGVGMFLLGKVAGWATDESGLFRGDKEIKYLNVTEVETITPGKLERSKKKELWRIRGSGIDTKSEAEVARLKKEYGVE